MTDLSEMILLQNRRTASNISSDKQHRTGNIVQLPKDNWKNYDSQRSKVAITNCANKFTQRIEDIPHNAMF